MWPSQTVRLRPLAVGERIDAAIKIVRSSFLTLAKAALVVGVPSGIVVAFLSASVHSSQENLLTTGANGTNLHTGALYPVLGGDLLTFVIALIVSAFVTVVCFASSPTPILASQPNGVRPSVSAGRGSGRSSGSPF